ncbi:EthD family reductase [Pseudonocardia acidicola]|uniref:EthD family reductase n=1 Tax=Pseudonocardia acidicola TaxID=2724939 RepID=A0ABX1S8C3_9PSEU|nr:EthD family reductase [Pseudonocardia acidicola]NMH96514.1 EthD family reductase [Pseudonocardia acidicola]
MYDVLVLYSWPADTAAFDDHYVHVHVPLVKAMPSVQEFTWGKVSSDEADAPYLVARMTYPSASDAERALSSPEAQAAVADLETFAGAGVQILNTTRSLTWQR